MSKHILENLAILSDILQTGSFVLNVSQSSNDEIMKELQNQNKLFLAIIIKQNEEIIEIIKRDKK